MQVKNGPLESLEQWDDFVKDRYDPNKTQETSGSMTTVRLR